MTTSATAAARTSTITGPRCDTYLFQTIRRVGDLEEEMSGLARVSLGTGTQRSAALVIDVDVNRFALQGVAGRPYLWPHE